MGRRAISPSPSWRACIYAAGALVVPGGWFLRNAKGQARDQRLDTGAAPGRLKSFARARLLRVMRVDA